MMGIWKIAICDDEITHLDVLYECLYNYFQEAGKKSAIEKYSQAEDLVADIRQNPSVYQMLLLDVEMSSLNGVDAARMIREISAGIIICFVTSYEDYAYKAYQVDAIGYLVKPIDYEKLRKVLAKASDLYQLQIDQREAEKRFIEISRKQIIVDSYDILYIEKRRNQSVLHLVDKSMEYYDTLSNIYKKLNQMVFCYTHQGFIVNFNRIKEVKRDKVCLGNDIEIPVSRKYYAALKDRHDDKIERLRLKRFPNC